MAEAKWIRDGKSIKITAGADIAAGEVVVLDGHTVGVAIEAIANGAVGEVFLEGVFVFAKTTGETWTAGGPIYFDESANEMTTTAASNKFAGIAAADAASGDTTGQGRLGATGLHVNT